MAYIYILKGENGRFYVGSTIDLSKRLAHHKGGYTRTTKSFGKLELVFSQDVGSEAKARKIEKRLKSLKRKNYLEKIVKDRYIKLAT